MNQPAGRAEDLKPRPLRPRSPVVRLQGYPLQPCRHRVRDHRQAQPGRMGPEAGARHDPPLPFQQPLAIEVEAVGRYQVIPGQRSALKQPALPLLQRRIADDRAAGTNSGMPLQAFRTALVRCRSYSNGSAPSAGERFGLRGRLIIPRIAMPHPAGETHASTPAPVPQPPGSNLISAGDAGLPVRCRA